jgi:hypothetical protein
VPREPKEEEEKRTGTIRVAAFFLHFLPFRDSVSTVHILHFASRRVFAPFTMFLSHFSSFASRTKIENPN